MNRFENLKCVKLDANSVAQSRSEIERNLSELPQWHLIEKDGEPRIERVFKFNNYQQGLDFTLRVGHEALEQDHHPTILTEYNQVTVDWWTHKVKGLHLNDFIMAAKTDRLYEKSR